MALYPESLTIPDIKPVVTMLGSTYLHHFIIDLINSDRLSYEWVEFGHNFECRKDRFGSNDGFIKLGWTSKRRRLIPSVVIVVFDWSQSAYSSPPLDNNEWRYKEQAINRELKRIREQNRSRLLKLAIVVLISGEIGVEEKQSLVRKQNDLDSKGIYFLQNGIEGIKPYLKKLEKYLYDSSMAHYKDEVDRLKRMKTKAYRENGWPEVQVRYNFKLGYLYELRRDKESALTCYKTSYSDLREIQPSSLAQGNEIRAVGDWILVRIYSLLLISGGQGRFNEALDFFRSHVSRFREFGYESEDVGTYLQFERYKWLFEQYSSFGDLVELYCLAHVNKTNLWTLPSFYFQSAAMYLIKRKIVFSDNETLQTQVVEWAGFIENTQMKMAEPAYVGQAWQLASHPLELEQEISQSYSPTERNLIIKTVNESKQTYTDQAQEYLIRAYKFNKSKNIMRNTMNYILAVLSEIYSINGDVMNSKVYKISIAKVYKSEGWEQILRFVYQALKDVAGQSNMSNEVLEFSTAYLAYDPDPEVYFDLINLLKSEEIPSTVMCESIKVSASFLPGTVGVYEDFVLEIVLTSQFPGVLDIQGVQLQFSDESFDQTLNPVQELLPGVPLQFSYNSSISIKGNSSLDLVSILVNLGYLGGSKFKLTPAKTTYFARLTITPPKDYVGIRFIHSPPALIGERYGLTVCLEPHLQLLGGTIQVVDNSEAREPHERRASVDRDTTDIIQVFHGSDRVPGVGLNIPAIDAESSYPLDLVFTSDGTFDLLIFVLYKATKTLATGDVEFQGEQSYPLQVVVYPPFDSEFAWRDSSGTSLITSSPAVLQAKLSLTQLLETPITIWSITPELTDDTSVSHSTFAESVLLERGQTYTCLFFTSLKIDAEERTLGGDLVITWQRSEEKLTTCRLPIPPVQPKQAPFTFDLSYPHEVMVGQTFNLYLTLTNHTGERHNLRLTILDHRGFLLAGLRHSSIEIEAGDVIRIDYVLFPEISGRLKIPKIIVAAETLEDKIIIEEAYNSAILVLPQVKMLLKDYFDVNWSRLMDRWVFCRIVGRDLPAIIIHEDEKVMVIEDIAPWARKHLLVITKEHVRNYKTATPEILTYLRNTGESMLPGGTFGYHHPWVASIAHIHLHCIEPPYTWLGAFKFSRPFFVPDFSRI